MVMTMPIVAREALALVVGALVGAICVRALCLWLWRRIRGPAFAFDGQVVLITGGAHGLGRALAETLLQRATRGVTLVLLDVDGAALERAQRDLTLPQSTASTVSRVLAFKCDVSDDSTVKECMQRVQQAIAPQTVNVLVNNAGIVSGQSIDHLSAAQVRRTLEVNVLGHVWLTQAVLPSMKRERQGLIVTVSSVMGLISGANLADYCASKAAVAAFHDCLRLELWRDGYSDVRTLLVCPNAVNTGMFNGIMDGADWTARLSRLLLPITPAHDAAERIYTAMERGEQLVVSCYTGWRGLVVPWLPAVARLLPVRWFDTVVYLGGGVHGMDTFVGKPKKDS